VNAMAPVTPVILSGGAGTRLWPMSREQYPKQLLPLSSANSMIQETALRFANRSGFAAPMILTGDALRFHAAEQMRLAGIDDATIVLEPTARNTAPAVAAAAFLLAETDPDAVMLVMPSDHVITDQAAFDAVLNTVVPAARAGYLVTFGITPTAPATGYGYIRQGQELGDFPGVHKVANFTEKPNTERAQAFLATGDYVWNSGMFLFTAGAFLAELQRLAPAIHDAVSQTVRQRKVDLDFVRLDRDTFVGAPSISIDYAVMERTDRAVTIGCDIGWTDVGCWSELWEIGDKDNNGNVVQGDVLTQDVKNSYLRSEGPLLGAVGVEDLVVVATEDAVLVIDKDRSQDVKLLVEQMRSQSRSQLATHPQVHRPWGFYQSIRNGERYQVKLLSVKPGAKLSLQKHYHRAEHWIVVQGTAIVTNGETTQIVRENESTYIPACTVHRLENPGRIPLHLIEVQSGSYLGEDDIVRLEDTYGRN